MASHHEHLCIFFIALLFKLLHGIFFIRVDAANEAIYELIAEPIQEQQVGESQAEEVVEPVSAEVANPADLQGKPRSITLTLNLQSVIKLCTCALSF